MSVVVADIYRLPFPRATFDLVWNSSTIEHLDRIDRAVAEMARVTLTAGRVFTGVPYLYGPLGFQRLIPNTAVGVWVGTVFTRAELKRLLASAGLRPVSSLRYFYRFFLGFLACKQEDSTRSL